MAGLRRIRTLLRIGHRGRRLIAEAAVRLTMARLALLLFPFHRLARGLGRFVPPDDARACGRSGDATAEAMELARSVGWAVRASAPFMPFKALCLQQALAAHAMLRKRGIVARIHLGAGHDEAGAIEAHAWLVAAGVEVTGYPLPARLREIGCFVPAGPPQPEG